MKNETDKLSCAVVRDLLPLYHDGVVSDETKADVEAHIADCSDCNSELEKLERELPADEASTDTRKIFSKFAKKRKRKNRLVNIICFVVGALIVLAAAVYFALWNKKIIPCPPGFCANEGLMIYHYKYDDCPYKKERTHYSDEDHALFVYMEEAYFTDWDVVIKDGDVNLQFKRPIWNPKLHEAYAMGTRYRISVIPIDDSCKTLSINGEWVCDIGEPNVNIPPYVAAYHEFESKPNGMWEELFIDEDVDENYFNKPPCDYFAYYPNGDKNGGYIKWDIDGNEIENTLG